MSQSVRFHIAMPVLIAAVAAIGYFVLRTMGLDPHRKELAAAAVVAVASSEMALLPLLLARGSSQLGVTQAGLVATLIHLLCCIAMAMGIMLAHLGFQIATLFWLLPFYGVTLVALVTACIRAIKEAPSAPATHK